MYCKIYRSPKKSETYIYVRYEDKLDKVPEELLKTFGEPEEVMALEIGSHSKLARTDASTVLQAIENEGYYLQLQPKSFELPGQKELAETMARIDELNEKLPRG